MLSLLMHFSPGSSKLSGLKHQVISTIALLLAHYAVFLSNYRASFVIEKIHVDLIKLVYNLWLTAFKLSEMACDKIIKKIRYECMSFLNKS